MFYGKRGREVLYAAIFSLGICGVSLPARSHDASHRQLLNEMLDLLGTEQQIQQVAQDIHDAYYGQLNQAQTQIPDNLKSVFKQYQDNVYKAIEQALDWQALKKTYVDAYLQSITEQEAAEIVSFLKSDAGMAFTSNRAKVSAMISDQTAARMDILKEQIARMSVEFQQKLQQAGQDG